jgi:hypothetical protein
MIIFGVFVVGEYIFDMPVVSNMPEYLMRVFIVVFPTVVAFAMIRQSNLKSKELSQIEQKELNSQYIVGSIKAINSIAKHDVRDEKMVDAIEKVLDSAIDSPTSSSEDSADISAKELKDAIKDISIVAKSLKSSKKE